MAVIQYTGLVSEVRGKLNGSVLSRGRPGNVIYKRPVQRKEPTAAQLKIRGDFSAIAASWRLLSPTERADWATIADANPLPNRFGDLRAISGYAYFQRMLSLASPELWPEPVAPDLTADPVYEFEPFESSLSIALTDQGYELTDVYASANTLNDSPIDNSWNLYISLPVSDFGLPYFKTWYLIGQGDFDAEIGADELIEFDVSSVTMPKGFRSFPGAKHLLKAVTYIRNQGGVSVEQIWNAEPSFGPVVEFPVLTIGAGPYSEGLPVWDGSSWLAIPWFADFSPVSTP